MISQKTKQRFNKVIIITAACSMFSMFGTSILHTKAATHSAAPAVYVSPQNIPASDIISIDWSHQFRHHLIRTGLYTTGMQVVKLEDMLVFNNKVGLMKMENVLYILPYGIQFPLKKQ